MTCPTHGTRIYGGPIVFECDADGGHMVRAADINHDYQPQEAAA